MKQCFVPHRFGDAALALIASANLIIDDYQRQGYTLTLRQLYYRLVTQNTIPNTVKSYKSLVALITQARMAGQVDWDAIEDRTRNLKGLRHWNDPPDALNWLERQYHVDLWADQPNRPEVWIEKEALAGVFERACLALDVNFFCCRGYTSASEDVRGIAAPPGLPGARPDARGAPLRGP